MDWFYFDGLGKWDGILHLPYFLHGCPRAYMLMTRVQRFGLLDLQLDRNSRQSLRHKPFRSAQTKNHCGGQGRIGELVTSNIRTCTG